jgi:hypothetical protein
MKKFLLGAAKPGWTYEFTRDATDKITSVT